MGTERPIGEVARMAGVSTRTLRHYDAIGLLRPVRVADSGVRWYGRRELLRLQQVLLLRQLQVPLREVADVLDGAADQVALLREHRVRLESERARLGRLVVTLDLTIETVEGTRESSDEEFFDNLTDGRERLQRDLRERYGDLAAEHVTTAVAATAGWDRAAWEREAAAGRLLLEQMACARAAGVTPTDAAALDLVSEHHRAVTAHWPADPAAYHALGALVVEQPDQRAIAASVDPGLPEWLGAAIQAYAVRRLGLRPDGSSG